MFLSKFIYASQDFFFKKLNPFNLKSIILEVFLSSPLPLRAVSHREERFHHKDIPIIMCQDEAEEERLTCVRAPGWKNDYITLLTPRAREVLE